MKNLKEIISQQDTVTPCVLNPLFLRHKDTTKKWNTEE